MRGIKEGNERDKEVMRGVREGNERDKRGE